MRLKGKVALITGASRGIGRAIASLFSEEGASIVINYLKSDTEASKLFKEIQQKGGSALLIKADVSNASEVKQIVQEIIDRFDRLDILVNNAGIVSNTSFFDVTEEIWDKILDTNLKSAFLLSKEAAVIMKKQGKGKIINISSVSGLSERSALHNAPYVVSKAGMIGLTRVLSVHLGPEINVNAICPGLIETDMAAFLGLDQRETCIEESHLKRIGTPKDIADAALFLASDESGFITGELLTVSGGRGMR